jgi:hypothetical protein
VRRNSGHSVTATIDVDTFTDHLVHPGCTFKVEVEFPIRDGRLPPTAPARPKPGAHEETSGSNEKTMRYSALGGPCELKLYLGHSPK